MRIVKSIPLILALLLVAVFSATRVSSYTTSPETQKKVIEQIDREIDTVLKLTAGSAGASAVISLLPDDQCTPIASELAEFSKYFLIVLSALYLEKYLVTALGFVSFSFLVPLACLALGIGLLWKPAWKAAAVKLSVLAACLYLMIPASAFASQLVFENYQENIEDTLEESERIMVTETDEDATVVEKFTAWISNAALTVTEYVTGLLSRFVDALAVMLVSSCLIPVVVILFCVLLVRILFHVQIPFPPHKGNPFGDLS